MIIFIIIVIKSLNLLNVFVHYTSENLGENVLYCSWNIGTMQIILMVL